MSKEQAGTGLPKAATRHRPYIVRDRPYVPCRTTVIARKRAQQHRDAVRAPAFSCRCEELGATPMSADLSAGIICFEVEGLTPREVVHGLHERGIVASVTPGFYPVAYARVAPGLLTSERDVETTVAAIAAL